MFDCAGGYGIVFDNSDLVVEEILADKNDEEGIFEVDGNHTVDERFQIVSVPDNETVIVEGNATGILTRHAVFLVVNVLQFDIVSNDSDSLVLSGNHADFLNRKEEFWVAGTETAFNGKYVIRSATHDADDDETTVEFIYFGTVGTNDIQGLKLNVRNSEPNTGNYQVKGYSFDGTNTTITVQNSSFDFTNAELGTYNKGSIQFRTAFKYSREIDIDISSGSAYHNTLHVEYDSNTNRTKIHVDGDISGYTVGVDFVRMFGYFFNSGYDGNPD